MNDINTGGLTRLHRIIETLIERLKMLSGEEGEEALHFATDVARSVLGTALDPETHANLDDDQTENLEQRVEGFFVVFDLIATVYLVEKLKMMSGMDRWSALRFVDEVCCAAIRDISTPDIPIKLDKEQMSNLFLTVEDAFLTIGLFDGDPSVKDLLPEIIKRHQR